MQPVLMSPPATELLWSDDFDGGMSQWSQTDLVDRARHRTGNKYLRTDGSVDLSQDWHTVPGRWAALYNDYRAQCQFIRDGSLIMKGYSVRAANPYRENFTDSTGVVHPYGDNQLYTSWLTSVHDVEKGTILEVRVNLEAQQMRGHRWNFWLMPKVGDAYDDDASSVEIDSPEVENPSRVAGFDFGQRAMLKVVGGTAGDTSDGNINLLTDHGIDIRTGWHTFTTVWNHSGSLEFYVDGVLCNRDDRAITMVAELIMAREMNSGVKSASGRPWENKTAGPYMPVDPGLTGQSVALDLDLIENDEVVVSHVRAWRIIEGQSGKISEPTADPSPIAGEIPEDYKRLLDEKDQIIEELTGKITGARDALKSLLGL